MSNSPATPHVQDRVIELRALGEAAVSISCCDLSVHASGGLQRLSWSHEVGAWPLWCAVCFACVSLLLSSLLLLLLRPGSTCSAWHSEHGRALPATYCNRTLQCCDCMHPSHPPSCSRPATWPPCSWNHSALTSSPWLLHSLPIHRHGLVCVYKRFKVPTDLQPLHSTAPRCRRPETWLPWKLSPAALGWCWAAPRAACSCLT